MSGILTDVSALGEYISINTALTTVVVAWGSSLLWRLLRRLIKKRNLAAKRKVKRDATRKALKQLRDRLNVSKEEGERILKLTLPELLAKLKGGEITAHDALTVYQNQALLSHGKTNCLVEPIWEADPQATELDKHQAKLKDKPLFGLPISLKDNYGLQGYDCVVGCAEWIDRPFLTDSVLVQVLKSQGAVPYVKTNVPQTMISWETTNPVFGPTRNPHDTTRGVGGSSGGEGALIASGGSLLGFGSDIGGSIRIPSALNGIYGFKPSENRLSTKGTHPIQKGQNAVASCYGPMARDVESLVVAMKALLVPLMWELDPTVPVMPFRDEIYESKKPLKIGYYVSDGWFHAVPAMQRGVLEAKAALERMGHEVVPWDYPDLGYKGQSFWVKVIFGDGGDELKDMLKYDAVDSAMRNLMLVVEMPLTVKKLLATLLRPFQPLASKMLKAQTEMSTITDWWNLVKDIGLFKESVMADWKQKGLDAVICPGFGCHACPLDFAAFAPGASSYTQLYNVLNFPAGSVPVTTVTKEDEDNMASYPTPDIWHSTVKKAMKGSTGLPINVQVATVTWQDELCLRVMRDLQEGLKTKA